MTHVEFVTDAGTLDGSRPDFLCYWFVGLWAAGPSEGEDLPQAGVDGDLPRSRRRGPLPVTLLWELKGGTDLAGAPGAADRADQLQANWYDLAGFFDAALREFFVELHRGAVVLEGEARHEQWGQPDWHGHVAKVAQQIVVPTGRLTVQP